MDKYEYKLKLDEVEDLVSSGDYAAAAEQCDSVNWNKVKNANTLCSVGEIYEKAGRARTAKEMYQFAYKRSPGSRSALYHLTRLSLELGDTADAENFYREYVDVAPKDPVRYVLEYQLACMKNRPLKERIVILENLKKREYTEKWAYELAYLYYQAGMADHCVDTCDELALWFGKGQYVRKALELKKYFRPLTAAQEEQYREILKEEEAARKAKEEAERKAREEAERKAKEEAERKAREEAERKAKEEAERKAREEAERKAKEEAEKAAREEAERKAREEAEKAAREEAERKAREEAEKAAQEEAEKKTREEAEKTSSEVETVTEAEEEIIDEENPSEIYFEEEFYSDGLPQEADVYEESTDVSEEPQEVEETDEVLNDREEVSEDVAEATEEAIDVPEEDTDEAESAAESTEEPEMTEETVDVPEGAEMAGEAAEVTKEPETSDKIAEVSEDTEVSELTAEVTEEPETSDKVAEVSEDTEIFEATAEDAEESELTEETAEVPENAEGSEEKAEDAKEQAVYEKAVETINDVEMSDHLQSLDDLGEIEEMPDFLKRENTTSGETERTEASEDYREIPADFIFTEDRAIIEEPLETMSETGEVEAEAVEPEKQPEEIDAKVIEPAAEAETEIEEKAPESEEQPEAETATEAGEPEKAETEIEEEVSEPEEQPEAETATKAKEPKKAAEAETEAVTADPEKQPDQEMEEPKQETEAESAEPTKEGETEPETETETAAMDQGEEADRETSGQNGTLLEQEQMISGFNAANLESHLEENIRKIESASEPETIREAMSSIRKMTDGVPYLEDETESQKDGSQEDRQKLQDAFHERLREEDINNGEDSEGTEAATPSSVEQFMSEWEKTKKVIEESIAIAQHSQLERERNQALRKANDIMIRLQEMIPALQREIVPEKADVIREMDEKNLTGSAPDAEPVKTGQQKSVEQVSPITTIVRGKAIEQTLEEAKLDTGAGENQDLEVLIDEKRLKEEEEKREKEEAEAKRAAAKEQSQQLQEHLKKAEQIMTENSTFKIAVENRKEEETETVPDVPDNLADLGDVSDWEEKSQTEADEDSDVSDGNRAGSEKQDSGEIVDEEIETTIPDAGEEVPVREVKADFTETEKTVIEEERLTGEEKPVEPMAEEGPLLHEEPTAAEEQQSEESPVTEEPEEEQRSEESPVTEEPEEERQSEESPVTEEKQQSGENQAAPEERQIREEPETEETSASEEKLEIRKEQSPEEGQVMEEEADQEEDIPIREIPADSIASFYEDAAGPQEISEEEEIPSLVLMPEEIRQFRYFISVPGMEIQITDAVSGVCYRTKGAVNSVTGNILIMGEEGSGKTFLATKLIRVIQQRTGRTGSKIGKISAVSLNRRDFASLAAKVAGGFLIVEHAGALTKETAIRMSQIMEQNTGGLVVVLEDTSVGIHNAMNLDRNFSRKFTEKIRIPIFNVEELVDFARSYAREMDASIDEMGRLALYHRIENIQRLDHATRLSEVKDIVDGAIKKAENAGMKKKFGSGRSRKYNENNRLILHEQDFEE